MEYTISGDSDISSVIQQGTIAYSGIIIGKSLCNFPDDGTVEANHLKISYQNGKWIADDVSQFGAFVKIPKNIPKNLNYGIYVLFGKTWMNTTNPKDIIFQNESFEVVARFTPVYNMTYIIGRGNVEEIKIPKDVTLSENHAKIIFRESNIEILDWKNGSGSTNGTYYSINKGFELQPDTIIRIGCKSWVRLIQSGTVPQQETKPGTIKIHQNGPNETNYIAQNTQNQQIFTDAYVAQNQGQNINQNPYTVPVSKQYEHFDSNTQYYKSPDQLPQPKIANTAPLLTMGVRPPTQYMNTNPSPFSAIQAPTVHVSDSQLN